MCLSPLKILNRSKVQIAGLTPSFYTVPCGKCWQCQQARRDSFTVRSIFEFLQAEKNGGYTLFLTLTYRDANLHTFCGVPLFNKDDVQKYLKRVRITLVRKLSRLCFGSTQRAKEVVSGNVRYFVSSENGDRFHRPHYHILFFVNTKYINKWFFRNVAVNCWQEGFAVPSKENFGFVTDVRGIKYVAKYVGKSMIDNEYYSNCIKVYQKRADSAHKQVIHYSLLKKQYISGSTSRDDDALSKLCDLVLRYSKIETFNSNIVQKLKENCPFLLCSKGLGKFAMSEHCPKDYRLTSSMFVDGKIFCPDNDGTVKQYILPEYYKRKSFYNVSSEKISKRHVVYRLNQFGIDVKTQTFDKYFQNYDQNIKDLLSLPVPESVMSESLVKDLGIDTVSQLRRYIQLETSSPVFKEYALLYSHYSQFLDDSELSEYCSPDAHDVYNFRLYVGSDTPTSIDLESLDCYYDFYLNILSRVHNIVTHNPLFPRVLALLECWQSVILSYLTQQQYVKDKILYDNKIMFEK